MQNIQNEHPTQPASQPASQPATLAELLAERAEEIAEQERERERQDQRARETARANALADADRFLQESVSKRLAMLLRITPAVDDNALESDDDYRPRPGYLQLDMRGHGVDDGDDAASDPNCEDRWSIRCEYIQFHGWEWILRGPHGYAVTMPRRHSYDACIDAGLLDAIAAYPAWLEAADEERRSGAPEA